MHGKKRSERQSGFSVCVQSVTGWYVIIILWFVMIAEQGKIVEVCAEPGEFTYDTSTEPSIFAGNLGESVIEVFKTIGKRFTFGGDTAKDQRVYYFNTKEIMDNKFGTPNPFMFDVANKELGMRRTV